MSFIQTWNEIKDYAPEEQRALRDALNFLLGEINPADIEQMSKKELQHEVQRSRQARLTTLQSYSKTDIEAAYQRGIDVTARNAEAMHKNNVAYMQAASELTNFIVAIDTLAAVSKIPSARSEILKYLRGDEESDTAPEKGVDKKLAGAYLWFTQKAREAGFTMQFDVVTRQTYERIEGIQRFVTQQDDGEYLRHIVETQGGDKLKEILAAEINVGGRSPGMTEWRKYVGRVGSEMQRNGRTLSEISSFFMEDLKDTTNTETAELKTNALYWLTHTKSGKEKTTERRRKDISEAINDWSRN